MASIFSNLQQFPALISALSNNPALLDEISAFKTDPGRIPGPISIPNCAQVRVFWTLSNGKTATNVLHGSYTGTFTPTVAMANTVQTSLNGGLTSSGLGVLLAPGTSLAGVGLRDLSALHLPEFISTGAPQAGTGTGAALPPQTSFVVTLRTSQSGQAGRGRVYLPGFASSADVGNGLAASGVSTAAPLFVTDIQTAIAQSGVALILSLAHPARQAYTGKTGTTHPARSAGTVPVVGIVAENAVWDTQRRRSYPI